MSRRVPSVVFRAYRWVLKRLLFWRPEPAEEPHPLLRRDWGMVPRITIKTTETPEERLEKAARIEAFMLSLYAELKPGIARGRAMFPVEEE